MKTALNKFSSKVMTLSKSKGFTLIELLIVITIIGALAVTVFVALNPAQRLADARDARRTSDVDSILTAVHQSIVDNGGNLPTNMPAAGTVAQLGSAGVDCADYVGQDGVAAACGTVAACADLMSGTDNLSAYLASMPIDPVASDANETGYTVTVDANGIVTVASCVAEGTTIQSSR